MKNNEECAKSKEAKIGNVVVKNNTSSKKSKPKKLLKRKEETVSKPVTLVVPVKKPRITKTPFAKIDASQIDKLPLKLDDVPLGLADTVLIPDIDLGHLNTQLGAGKCHQTSVMSNKVLSIEKLKHEKRKEDNLKTDNAKKVASTSHVGKLAHEIQFIKNELKKREVFEKNILEQMSKLIATSEQNKKMLQSITDNWNEFRGIYHYYLEPLNKTPEEVQVELKKTKDYISSKISDMRIPPVSKKSLKKDEEIDDEQLEEELEDDGIEVSQSSDKTSDEEADDLREKQDQEKSDIEDVEKPEFAESDGESDRNIIDATGNESEHSATEKTEKIIFNVKIGKI
ncbi:hypothetical protein G9C98_001160 [Cotesia typhae]|uniref:Uncharacterized protein n=1 Tax=Cotesia typhae TaxID=2053667 RepID=A0A8J5RHH7_9HYME|nr:hypothetical protein G9C98_001160 [Cotesia typhae]